VRLLAALLDDASVEVVQTALLVIANLCSDSVDANSSITKAQLIRCGGARPLLACLYSDDTYTITLACGALQNLCYDREWAEHVVAHGVQAQLESLLSHEDQSIVRYASGALTNVATHLPNHLSVRSSDTLEAVRARKILAEEEKRIYSEAMKVIGAYARAIPHDVRERRRYRARQRFAQIVGGRRWGDDSGRPSSAGSQQSVTSGCSTNTMRSYATANTMSSASHASGSTHGDSTYGGSMRGS